MILWLLYFPKHTRTPKDTRIALVALDARTTKKRLFSLKYDGGILRTSECPIAELLNANEYHLSAINPGILILVKYGQSFLLNPFRGKVLMLPATVIDSPSWKTEEKFGFGFDSTTKEYKVLRVFTKYYLQDPPVYGAEDYTLSTKSWQKISSVFPYKVRYEMPISAYGDIHWMISYYIKEGSAKSMIISFDYKREEFKLTPHPEFCCKEYTYFSLVDLRRSLAILNLSPTIHMEIWVLKDYARKEWAQEYVIRIAEVLRFRDFRNISFVGAWEEGLLFEIVTNSTFFYCNLKTGFRMYIYRDAPTDAESNKYHSRIYCYRGSLVSLRNHGNLMVKEVCAGNCFDFTAAGVDSVLHLLKI